MAKKRCSKCQVEKPLTSYQADSKNKDGLRTECRECRSASRANPVTRSKQTISRMKHNGLSIDITTHDIAWTLGECRCSYCGVELEYSETTLDHITPLDRQGPNTFANTTVACRSCNSRKGKQPALIFMLTECETYYNRKLLEQIALRRGVTTEEIYTELVIDAQGYFAEQSAQAVST